MASTRWPAEVDDRPQRVQERRARLAVGQRGVAAQDLAHVGVHAQPDAAEQTADRAGRRRATRSSTSSGSTSSEPGRLAARSSALISRPRPPLLTSTSRSQCSGNW